MARLCYATEAQLRELIRQSGLPENAPPANAFRMFAHSPAVGPPPCDWYSRYSPRPTSIQNCGSW